MENLVFFLKIRIDTTDKSSFLEKYLENVTSHELCDFMTKSFIEFKPSMETCENTLKSIFLEGLKVSSRFNECMLEDPFRPEKVFNFESLQPYIISTIGLIDDFLSDAFLSLIAVQFYLQSFEHLFLSDTNSLLENEIAMLVNDNQFDELRVEICKLQIDAKYLERLEGQLYVGLFKVDISSLISRSLEKISNAINNCLQDTIYKKLVGLRDVNQQVFERNRLNLTDSVETIDKYMKMKVYLNSIELKEDMEKIETEVGLSQELFDFLEKNETQLQKQSDVDKYFRSMMWMGILEEEQERALFRMEQQKPKFIEELKEESEALNKRLDEIMKMARECETLTNTTDYQSNFSKAEIVYNEFEDLYIQSEEVRNKQKILDDKESTFDQLRIKREYFEKYYKLWYFIAIMWLPNVSIWWSCPFQNLTVDMMRTTITNGENLLRDLKDRFSSEQEKHFEHMSIIEAELKNVLAHKGYLNHIIILKNPCFKERHWEELFDVINESKKGIIEQYTGKH